MTLLIQRTREIGRQKEDIEILKLDQLNIFASGSDRSVDILTLTGPLSRPE